MMRVAEDRRPSHGGVCRVVGGVEQPIDQLPALLGRIISQEAARLVHRRQPPARVEHDTSQKRRIVRLRRRQQAELLPLFHRQLIDVGARLKPRNIGSGFAVWHDRPEHPDLALKPRHDDGFAFFSTRTNDAIFVDGGDRV